MTHVYILGDYEEHGLEHVQATLDKSKLFDLFKDSFNSQQVQFTAQDATHSETIKRLRSEAIDYAKKIIETVQLTSTEELVSASPISLSRGWGGYLLYINELV